MKKAAPVAIIIGKMMSSMAMQPKIMLTRTTKKKTTKEKDDDIDLSKEPQA